MTLRRGFATPTESQVIDITQLHFGADTKILRHGGSYIFRAPNVMFGPADLSKVFGTRKAIFMHLHEFSWSDVKKIRKACGYKSAKAVFRVPKTKTTFTSGLYFHYLCAVEKLLESIPALKKRFKYFKMPEDVWVELTT